MVIDDNTLQKAAEEMYPRIRELVDRYGISFSDGDKGVTEYIKKALEFRYKYDSDKLSGQEIYDSVQADISRGLIYIIKIVDKLLQEDPLTTPLLNLKQVAYHTQLKDGTLRLCLCFKNFWAYLRIRDDGILVRWHIGSSLDWEDVDRLCLIPHMVPSMILAKSVQDDLKWLTKKLYDLYK